MSNLNENLIPLKKLNPFGKFCCTIGHLPASYMLSLTYEEQILWLCNYLENTVIPAINNNAEATEEIQQLLNDLKKYIDNYFSNLDVQDEINNKLDEMAESGELAEIINDEKIFAQIVDTSIFGQVIVDDLTTYPQSFCIFENSIVVGGSGDGDNSATLVKMSLLTGKRIAVLENQDLGHVNSMTYCLKDNYIYIACGGGDNGIAKIAVYDTDLNFIKNIDFSNISNSHPYGITYIENDDTFAILFGSRIIKVNYDFTETIKIGNLITKSETTVSQSIYNDNKYIYFIINFDNNLYPAYKFNRIEIYNLHTLSYVGSQKVSILGEIEDGCHYNGETYLMRTTQSTGLIYKASNLENEKIQKFIDNNLIFENKFPIHGAYYDIYINSNYRDFYCDGSNTYPFNNLWVAESLINNVPNPVRIYAYGDFSDKDFNVKHFDKTLVIQGLSANEKTNIGGIYLQDCINVAIYNINIVKRSGTENNLLTCRRVKNIYLDNVTFTGNSSVDRAIALFNSYLYATNLIFNNTFNNLNQMILISQNSNAEFNSNITNSSNGKITNYTDNSLRLPYRPSIEFLKNPNDYWNTKVIGGNISFYLKDIKLKGQYRVESNNNCVDAPGNLAETNFKFSVDYIGNSMFYKVLSADGSKLYFGTLLENASDISWHEVY